MRCTLKNKDGMCGPTVFSISPSNDMDFFFSPFVGSQRLCTYFCSNQSSRVFFCKWFMVNSICKNSWQESHDALLWIVAIVSSPASEAEIQNTNWWWQRCFIIVSFIVLAFFILFIPLLFSFLLFLLTLLVAWQKRPLACKNNASCNPRRFFFRRHKGDQPNLK